MRAFVVSWFSSTGFGSERVIAVYPNLGEAKECALSFREKTLALHSTIIPLMVIREFDEDNLRSTLGFDKEGNELI